MKIERRFLLFFSFGCLALSVVLLLEVAAAEKLSLFSFLACMALYIFFALATVIQLEDMGQK